MAANLAVATAPTVLPVSFAQVKTHLRVDDGTDDAYIESLIRVARDWVETYTGRALITTTYDLTLDGFSGTTIELPRSPAASITSIKTYTPARAESTMSASDYWLYAAAVPSLIVLGNGKAWPTGLDTRSAVVVRFVAGYGGTDDAIPDGLKQGLFLIVTHLYEHRGDVPTSGVLLDAIPALRWVLAPYRVRLVVA